MIAINLDNNATTRPSPGVVDAVAAALRETWHNPSSVHRGGQEARRVVELAREHLARLIGARPREVVLTSGGTESLDLAIRGVLAARKIAGTPNIVTTRIEHAAVRDLGENLAVRAQAQIRHADIRPGGVVDAGHFESLLDDRTALAVVQWANNETGAIQPIDAIGTACRARAVPLICDGTQWIGKEPADVGAHPFDALVFSPHKFHGPKGVGVLWVRPGLKLSPVLHGSQELGRRGGTENVPGIAGAGVAAAEAIEWLRDPGPRSALAALRDRFESLVTEALPDATINAPADGGRLWNTSNIAFPKLEAEALLMLLSERGVYASAGAACSSGSLEPSPVLLAMGVPPELAHGSIRFSLSRHTSADEVDRAAAIVVGAVKTLGRSSDQVIGRPQ